MSSMTRRKYRVPVFQHTDLSGVQYCVANRYGFENMFKITKLREPTIYYSNFNLSVEYNYSIFNLFFLIWFLVNFLTIF